MGMDAILQLKTNAKAAWATGSYNDIAAFVPPAAHRLVAAAHVQDGDHVLDVATGTGVTAIAARRTGAKVVALDLTPELLQVAKEEAGVADLQGITWQEGDAENLPFPDATFDVVLSSFGHMFAPRPDVVIAEMLRVLKPGGRLSFVTHRKGNVANSFFAAMGKHVAPPVNPPPSPFLWGDVDVVRQRLGDKVRDVRSEDGSLDFPAVSVGHFWRLFSTKYGPTMKAVQSLGGDRAKLEALRRDFIQACAPFWTQGVVKMDYVLTRATKR
ncbi:MAG: methyltransferase domain-containing protein [Euryarchaeota archaeon]|nr:methyltransferase domain-containing protein [Euryarchaeota archaeon]